jgi:hypothetical protein
MWSVKSVARIIVLSVSLTRTHARKHSQILTYVRTPTTQKTYIEIPIFQSRLVKIVNMPLKTDFNFQVC